MIDATAILEELLMATLANQKTSLTRKSKMDWALMALSVLLLLVGGFFLVLSLYVFFEGKYTQDIAALLSAGVIFIAAFIIMMVMQCSCRKPAPAQEAHREVLGKNLRALIEDICGELNEPVQENPKLAVLIAALAGFFAARYRNNN